MIITKGNINYHYQKIPSPGAVFASGDPTRWKGANSLVRGRCPRVKSAKYPALLRGFSFVCSPVPEMQVYRLYKTSRLRSPSANSGNTRERRALDSVILLFDEYRCIRCNGVFKKDGVAAPKDRVVLCSNCSRINHRHALTKGATP